MRMAAAGIASNVAGIVGPAKVITDSAQLTSYRIGDCVPKAAVQPTSALEVAEIVRLAIAEKLAIVPVGARTKLHMNIPLQHYDLALDMTRLDRVVAYDPDDLTVSVGPGITLHKLAEVLGEHRQFLPLAVPFFRRATVGGAIASGFDSPLRQFYGTARDYLLGMEFVTGEGQIVKSGGRVVKNVSGYDLHKLMIGSFGSLGVITKVNFRTFPVPATVRAFISFFEAPQAAGEMRQRLAQSPLRPLTLEILSPSAAELLAGGVAARVEPGNLSEDAVYRDRWACLVSYAGTEAVLERYEREIRQIASGIDALALKEDVTAVALARVREFVPIALEFSPAAVVIKMSVLPTQMADLLGGTGSIAAELDLPWAAIARGVGLIYFVLLPQSRDEETRSRVGRAIEKSVNACQSCAGNISVPWCPHEWRVTLPRLYTDRDDVELMRKLKHVFDPGGVFAPDPLTSGT